MDELTRGTFQGRAEAIGEIQEKCMKLLTGIVGPLLDEEAEGYRESQDALDELEVMLCKIQNNARRISEQVERIHQAFV